MLTELINYYQSTTILKKDGTETKLNELYGEEYSLKAVEYLQMHSDDGDLEDSLRDARIKYGEPDMGYNELISYHIYKQPKVEHTKICKRCGYYFNYESIIKPINFTTGLLSIPNKCPECSER